MQLLLLFQFINVLYYQVKAKHYLIQTEGKGANEDDSNPRGMVRVEQLPPNNKYLLIETDRTLSSDRSSEESYLYDYGPRR